MIGDLLAQASAAAEACGVTRLGEISRLDRIGVPIFHAIRPWSRSLSVHQGKGLTVLEAQVGALMEAVESAHAEDFEGAPVISAFADLPVDERAPALADFAAARELAPSETEPLAWVAARRHLDGGRLWVPFPAVSLDFTHPPDPWLSRSSNGQAAHFDAETAIVAGLLELIERDAIEAWFQKPVAVRTRTRVDLRGMDAPWFAELHARIAAAGLRLSVYELPCIIGLPALLAELVDLAAPHRRGQSIYGTACDPSAEQALKRSVLEAAQSRATEIAGSRDDIPYRTAPAGGVLGLASPPPALMALRSWSQVSAGSVDGRVTAEGIARRLAQAGYPQAAVVDLSPPGSEVFVAKAFTPGLGAFGRSRRPGRRPR